MEFISAHMTECRKHGYKPYRLLIIADTKANARTIGSYLKTAWGAASIKDDSGGDSDLSLVFDHVWQRDQAVQEINEEVNAYRLANPGSIFGSAPTPTDIPEKESPDWTTYIIIGVAAAAIILLIWPKKKKRP